MAVNVNGGEGGEVCLHQKISKTTHSGEVTDTGCQTNNNKNKKKQGKIELLSIWTIVCLTLVINVVRFPD